MSDYCEDSNNVKDIEKCKLAREHSKTEHPFVATNCPNCDEEICAACATEANKVHDIGIEIICPFCGHIFTYLC